MQRSAMEFRIKIIMENIITRSPKKRREPRVQTPKEPEMDTSQRPLNTSLTCPQHDEVLYHPRCWRAITTSPKFDARGLTNK